MKCGWVKSRTYYFFGPAVFIQHDEIIIFTFYVSDNNSFVKFLQIEKSRFQDKERFGRAI